jgi:hypothetical protein
MYKTLFNNLWKATTAYIVGSFALIQFASVSFTYFDLEASIGLTNTEIMKISIRCSSNRISIYSCLSFLL